MGEIEVGVVRDFFAHPGVAGIELTGELKLADRIRVKGHTTDLEFGVASMQIDRQDVGTAQPGQSIGIKVPERVRPGDRVYKVTP